MSMLSDALENYAQMPPVSEALILSLKTSLSYTSQTVNTYTVT